MNVKKNSLSVDIFGQQYQITGASSTHIKQVSNLVDDKMRQIATRNSKLDTTRLAVLAACNIADEYLELKQKYEELLELVNDEQP